MIDSVRYTRALYGEPPDDAHIESVLRSLALWDKRGAATRELSGGMKRRLMIARAMMTRPRLLMGDVALLTALLDRLGIAPGARLRLGTRDFVVADRLEREADALKNSRSGLAVHAGSVKERTVARIRTALEGETHD